MNQPNESNEPDLDVPDWATYIGCFIVVVTSCLIVLVLAAVVKTSWNILFN